MTVAPHPQIGSPGYEPLPTAFEEVASTYTKDFLLVGVLKIMGRHVVAHAAPFCSAPVSW